MTGSTPDSDAPTSGNNLLTKDENNDDYDNNNVINEHYELQGSGIKSIVPGSRDDPYSTYRWIKQCLLVSTLVCVGLGAEILGPTLPSLVHKINTNYENISQALSIKSIGLLFGSIFAGITLERFNKKADIILASGLLLGALSTIATPFSESLVILSVVLWITGFCEGILNTGGNTLVMQLWGSKAAPHMHALHFGFGLGAIISPQIARPFLAPHYIFNRSYNQSHPHPTYLDSRIEIPYGIIAAIFLLVSGLTFLSYFIGPPKGFPKRKNQKDFKYMANPGSCSNGKICYSLALFACLNLYFIQALGGSRVYGRFLFSYATEKELPLTNDSASFLQSFFWLSFALGRFLGSILALFLSVRVMIIGDVIGNIASALILSFFAESSNTILWVCTAITGACLGVGSPNGLSWANLHLNMNSVGVMVIMIGASFGAFLYQLVTGILYEQNPHNIMYIMIFFAIMLGISFILMECSVLCNKRFKKDTEDNTKKPDKEEIA